jgi:hypothetical protein
MTVLQDRLSRLPTASPFAPTIRPLKSLSSATGLLAPGSPERPARQGSRTNLPALAALTIRPRSVVVKEMTVRPQVPKPTHVPALAKQKRFPVAAIDFSKKDVGLPYGVPRKISARTLKELAGGSRTDQLLKHTRSGWEFVPDSTLIDLSDNAVVYKAAGLTIFS